MNKPISPKPHGALDYGFLSVMACVPRTLGLVEKCGLPLYIGLPLVTGPLKESRVRAFFLATGVMLVVVYNSPTGTAPNPEGASWSPR